MKTFRPWLAFVLSFNPIIPGAGLVYLGKWSKALVNFFLFHAILLSLIFGLVAFNLGCEFLNAAFCLQYRRL